MADPGGMEAAEPDPEQPRLSWAEVYRVNTCDNCGHADCPRCVNAFLALLHQQGASRTSDAKGLA